MEKFQLPMRAASLGEGKPLSNAVQDSSLFNGAWSHMSRLAPWMPGAVPRAS